MLTPMANPNLHLALSKARERKLLEEAATVRLLKQAGSNVRRMRPGTLALVSMLLTKRI